MQLTPRQGIHHAILGRSTARTTTASGSRHHLFPFLLVNLDNVLHHFLLINGRTCQLIVRQTSKLYQVLLQVDDESDMVHVGLFLIHVDVV
jgi:hypothetical protein